jgi:signal recognition particle GTPase
MKVSQEQQQKQKQQQQQQKQQQRRRWRRQHEEEEEEEQQQQQQQQQQDSKGQVVQPGKRTRMCIIPVFQPTSHQLKACDVEFTGYFYTWFSKVHNRTELCNTGRALTDTFLTYTIIPHYASPKIRDSKLSRRRLRRPLPLLDVTPCTLV